MYTVVQHMSAYEKEVFESQMSLKQDAEKIKCVCWDLAVIGQYK